MSKKATPLDSLIRKQNTKLVLVVQNFFTKALQIIVQARSVPDPTVGNYSDDGSHSSKFNKWFNLHMASMNAEWLRLELKLWKSSEISQLPPMIIETYLDLRLLSPREIVTLEDDNGHSWAVAEGGSKKQEVVIERWLIEFDRAATLRSTLDELPLIYKQAIVLLRVLYGVIRLLPAFKLKKLVAKLASKNLALRNRFIDGKQVISSKGRIGLSKALIPHQMLMTESHLTQRDFAPIETTLGTLRVSVAYRNHHKFRVQDHEERLSDHFLISDKEKLDAEQRDIERSDSGSAAASGSVSVSPSASDSLPGNDSASASGVASGKKLRGSSFGNFREKYSVLPCTSEHQDNDTKLSRQKLVTIAGGSHSSRPGIQPFRVGSISNSPPPQNTPGTPLVPSSSMERRISITSGRSGSNASLVALLRTARGSMSNTPNTVAISNSLNNNISFPRSISSSHGSHLQGDENLSENVSSTPRFSSSFGSRQSRRFSNTSRYTSTPMNEGNTSLLGTSVELQLSPAPLSGLYVDDDISAFVRMIDGKSDLRLNSSGHVSKLGGSHDDSSSQLDALGRFQLLKSQHQQLGESVSASLVLHHHPGSKESQNSGSKPSSRKSSHSVHTPPPSGSYDAHLPSISSRLHDSGHSASAGAGSPRGFVLNKSSYPGSYLKSSGNKLASSPLTATTIAHATHTPGEGVSGMATSPSIYRGAKGPIHYEDVFEDDYEGDYYASPQEAKARAPHELSYDHDDLLFEMTDTK